MRQQPATIALSCALLAAALCCCTSGIQAEAKRVDLETATKASILKDSTINDSTFQRSQSKGAANMAAAAAAAAATWPKSLSLISATIQATNPKDKTATTATTTTTASRTTMTSEKPAITSALNANATGPAHSIINNISNHVDQLATTTAAAAAATSSNTMATSVPAVTLEANLIMSNRNVEQQKLDEHKYKITQHSALSLSMQLPVGNGNSTPTLLLQPPPPPPTVAAFAINEMATATAQPATTTATTTTAAATTTTTTRRPAPTTTLKPPPTIDDYQTIISQAGTHAYLPCNVKQLVKKPISWLRMRDGHILTVDQTTFIADQRFQSVFSPNPERWSLQIKYVQLKDEGTYECQVSTEPKASAIVHLRIVEPKTELIGESTRHVKAGSQVKLRCIISQALEPPLFINWFYNQKQIYLHNRRGWRTEIERIDLPTEAPTTVATTTTAAAAAEALNEIAAITRSYILDAIVVSDGAAAHMNGYGYVPPTTAAAAATTHAPLHMTAAAMSTPAAAAAAAAAAVADANPFAATVALKDATGLAAAAAATFTSIISTATATVAAASTTAADTTTTEATTTTTTTTTEASTSTTTLVPSSSFIKQITTASLIIPAVVKQDSGNYTCSPSNSAPRTIVLHVLNGDYSASAIKSSSVSWHALIGCRGYLQWPNVSTILALFWIIKFVLAANVAMCSPGQNKVNSRAATTLQAPMSKSSSATKTKTAAAVSAAATATNEIVNRRLCKQIQTATRRHSQSQSRLASDSVWVWGWDCDCICDCGHVNSSISGTQVAEDKT
ncbi:mucin-5AC [Drosophila busckii]|uniref:mucin-5AC n=1 Tax=Drosophila busckii TaxID=30019 RepID=UPI00083EE548|nr:mucin-5AC [Drosophila busckii]